MPANDHYVIIGNGPAGNAAADVLRENDQDAKISIISDEAIAFYNRHMLCEFIDGKKSVDELKARPYSDYTEKRIRTRLGQKVERIDPEAKVLYLEHMEKVSYTKLLLAVGGRPRLLPSLQSFETYLTFMSSYNDAVALKPKLASAGRILIIGGDLISIRFIKMLAMMGKELVFMLKPECFWPVELTSDMVESIRQQLKRFKVDILVDESVKQITLKDNAYRVMIESGKNVDADMVCCFMGLIPNIRFIVGSGIDTERGILVNEYLQTNFKDIFACGDCAQIYNAAIKDYWISIGWENAVLQGRVAAHNLLGDHQVIEPVPRKLFEVEGLTINTSWWTKF